MGENSVAESTLHWYKGGALDLSFSVMDTADVVADGHGYVSVLAVSEYITRQGVYVHPGQVAQILAWAASQGEMAPMGSGVYRWLDVEPVHG